MTKAEFEKLPKYDTQDALFAALKDGTFPKHDDVEFRIDNDSIAVVAIIDVNEEECESEDLFHKFPCTSEEFLMDLLNEVVGVKAEGV